MVLLLIKRAICALGYGSSLIEFCESCGRETDRNAGTTLGGK